MPFNNKRNSRDDKSGTPRRSKPNTPHETRGYREDSGTTPYNKRRSGEKPPFKSSSNKPFREGTRRWEDKPSSDHFQDRERRPFSEERQPRNQNQKPNSGKREQFEDRRRQDDRPNRFGAGNREQSGGRRSQDQRQRFDSDGKKEFNNRWNKDERPQFDNNRREKPGGRKRRTDSVGQSSRGAGRDREDDGRIRLNRYIANAGICSRRKADELIEAGVISVNGEIVTELGTKVDPAKDEVRYNGERLKREKLIYVLLNKPKDYITTTDDPQERRTVMHLVTKATNERIYPIGRLDRNTTGLLLMTNDGNLAEKLAHPRNNISKIYHVELSKNLTQGDMNKIAFGLELEDGFVKPDDVTYVQGASKREIGIQIHSGKNRIVRRIFEHLGYEVVKLDRVVYAHLTKKDLPRGRWRYLTDKEVIQLKHFTK